MQSIAHIVNLFKPSNDSDLKLAQEVTISSMLAARNACSEPSKVQLLSAQIREDRNVVSQGFVATQNLDRNVFELGTFSKKMELPILKDILDRLYKESVAEYLIFSNVDIGVQPDFYNAVSRFIDDGNDAFIINRRRISDRFTSVNQLAEMYKENGKKHPGFDCFVFKRELYPKFSLAEVCIGVPFIGITLAQNIFCFAKQSRVFTNEHLTFHIGMEIFKGRAPKQYFNYNRAQFWKAMAVIYPKLDTRKWPHGKAFILWRFIYWGINPSLPLQLAWQLERKRWRF